MRKAQFFFIFLILPIFLVNFIFATDKINLIYLPNNLTILRGETETTRVVLENRHNETINWIELKYDIPEEINLTKITKEVEYIDPDTKTSFNFNITVEEDANTGDNEINLWVESEGSKLSENHKINITVPSENSSVNSISITTTLLGITNTQIQRTTTISTQSQMTKDSITTTTQKKSKGVSKIPLIVGLTISIFLIIAIIILSRKKSGFRDTLREEIKNGKEKRNFRKTERS